MVPLRITDPLAIDNENVAALMAERGSVAIQFSKPPYSRGILSEIDVLCKKYQHCLEVRFYSHDSSGFDCSVLRDLPSVVNLSLDCMKSASNIEVLRDLENLRWLSLGVFELEEPNILSYSNLQKLHTLRLGDTKRCPINLAPLASYSDLKVLFVGSSKNIEYLGRLASLETLRLGGIKKNVELRFVNNISSLRMLSIILGGRENIDEIRHHGLKSLEIIRVMGISRISPDAFPALEELQIEDQIRLERIVFSEVSQNLNKVLLLNCKTLGSLSGLRHLHKLSHLRIARTDLLLDQLINDGLPSNLKTFAFYSKSKAGTTSARARLDELGYSEWGHP